MIPVNITKKKYTTANTVAARASRVDVSTTAFQLLAT